MVELIRAHFPAGTQVAEPTGGCVLWITLPGHIDAEILFHQALKQQIHVFPGAVFSPGRNHYNCLRINAGGPVTQKLEEIVAQLGELTRRL